MKSDIFKCSRCGEDHGSLDIEPLTNPIKFFDLDGNCYIINYWTMCPNLDEPILISVLEIEE